MRVSRPVKLLFLLGLGGILLTICVATGAALWLVAGFVSGDAAAGGEFRSNRIAFVGNDGSLWLAAPYKDELQQVTPDGRGYRLPTWSQDGRRLAFIGQDEEGKTTLFVSDGARREPMVLFNSPDAPPFYAYWSPDGRSVAFLTQETSNLAMRLADAEDPGTVRVMAQGAPFYWAWSPDGDQLLMHVGGARALSNDAHLSFLKNEVGAERVELKLAPGHFQAPAWSAGGQHVFYIVADGGGEEAIYKTDVDTSEQTLVTRLNGPTYMVLSPDDARIAYLRLQSVDQFPALGTAFVVDTDGNNEREIIADWVAAMYWSPDGKKLALLTPTAGDEGPTARVPGLAAPNSLPNRYRWWIYDLDTGTLGLLTSFAPTVPFLETVPYFDQYHLSLTFWSPDSRYFVITQQSAEVPGGTVWVYDTTGEEPPRKLGEGTFAVWSWQ
jgi:TolB protein